MPLTVESRPNPLSYRPEICFKLVDGRSPQLDPDQRRQRLARSPAARITIERAQIPRMRI